MVVKARANPLTDPASKGMLCDRSGAETDDKCGMAYWHNRKTGGKGIVPVAENIHFVVGGQIHEDFAALAQMEDISAKGLERVVQTILAPLSEEDKKDSRKMELVYRRLGWIVSWALFMEPVIRDGWDNHQIEGELLLDRNPLYVAVTPDRLLRNKKHGFLKYLEYKSTRYATQQWLQSWPFQIQIHTSLAAVKEEFAPLEVRYATVCGLMKGNKSFSDGRLVHPYVWAYENTKTGEWSHEYQRGSDWISMPVWKYPGGIIAWVLKCGEDCARLQFPQTAPIFLNDIMLDGWIKRRTYREGQIAAVTEMCRKDPEKRKIYFEQRTRSCRPAFGDPCPYLPACWNAEIASAPEKSELFTERKPHHEVEIIGLEL